RSAYANLDGTTAGSEPAFGTQTPFGTQTLSGTQTLDAQGRRPINTPPPSSTPGAPEPPPENQPTGYTEESSSAVSANGFLAVTGSYGIGTSVLYLVDTKNQQLAVYEARGGAAA